MGIAVSMAKVGTVQRIKVVWVCVAQEEQSSVGMVVGGNVY